MPETQDDEYSALGAAIGALTDATFDEPETPAPDPIAPVVPEATAEATPTPDAAETPQPDAEQAAAETDPLKDAEPFTYKVDREIRTIDGAQIVPGLGAIIPTEVLATVQDRLGQADRLHAINKTQYETIQRFEQAGGHDAIQKLNVEKAQAEAAAVTMLQTLLDNPDVLAQIALAETREARQQILNATVLREARLAAREARWNTVDAPQQQPTIDLTVPETRDTVLSNSVAHVAKEAAADFPGLTPEDIAFVTAQAKRFSASILSPATPDQAREAKVKAGDTIVRFDMIGSLLRDRSEWRASQQSLAAKATDAAKQNAARLAAAAKTKTTPTPKAAPAKPGTRAPGDAPRTLDDLTTEELNLAHAAGHFASDYYGLTQ